MSNTSAEAFAPATVANLGVGFDIIGLALEEPGDTVCAEWCEGQGARVLSIEGDGGKLPLEAEKNTAAVAANSLLRRLGVTAGVGLRVQKGLPLASGLGSSAASAVAAAVAVNALLGKPLPQTDLLFACLDGEAAVSGYHADNVGPCLFGGITLVLGTEAGQIQRLPVPVSLYLAFVTPDVAVPTAVARSVLPSNVPLHIMVSQTAGVARLVDALYRDDLEAFAAAAESDGVIEPARAHLMPRLAEIRLIAKRAGAFGLFISGAGPTLCAVCDSHETARMVATAMQAGYAEAGIDATARATQVAQSGARLLRVT